MKVLNESRVRYKVWMRIPKYVDTLQEAREQAERYYQRTGVIVAVTVAKLSKKQRTEAFQQYARKHGYYTRTVRHMTSLKQLAIQEYTERKAGAQ